MSRESNAETEALPVTYRRLSDVRTKLVHWLWQGLIARGKVSLVAGHPGLGKSQLTISMAAVVSTGGQWPAGQSLCESGTVLFLSAEDNAADTIRPRLEAAGADVNRVFILDAVREWTDQGTEISRGFDLKRDVTKLRELVTKIGDVALVVIDPLSAYLGGIDGHNNAEVRALLTPLAKLAEDHDLAVVCVAHLNKGNNTQALTRVNGSMAFVAAARAAFIVERDKEDSDRRLFLPLKNNLGADQTGLAFRVQGTFLPGDIETSCVIWEPEPVTVTADEAMAPGPDAEKQSALEDAKAILSQILLYGPVPGKKATAEALEAGLSERTIRRARTALGIRPVKHGFSGGWIWTPSREGVQR